MASSKRNSSAGGAGARKVVLLTTANTAEFIPARHVLQVRRLAAKFGLTISTAATIARLAFHTGRATQ